MKLAKASEEEIQRLSDILSEIEWMHKDLKGYDFEYLDFTEYEILSKFDRSSPEKFLEDLVRNLSAIHFQRILFNLTTLLENCADPDLDYLDFNKNIKQGLELLEKQNQSPNLH